MSEQTQSTPDDTHPFDPAEYCMGESVGYLMARAKNVLSHEVEQEVTGLDITHAQATCLMMLAAGRGSTVTDLGRELNTDMGSVTRLLSRMEKRGLIERQRSDADRRVVDLSITPAGRILVDELPRIYCRVLNRHFKGFSDTELQTFRSMLHRIISNNSG
ncbi:MarR family winged helix-turn-helix transcriptional regulator [Cupriavidus basilensis]|uniref:MarR family winged helix-turn-helix transcriptional regulator n=1 Tax=Cupriavidus TaxID=106589 RepID=UPI0004496B78|nr:MULTISPECIES: MarR family transcriptional regulator [Cupriavidus]KDP85990.1 MarR family transcriptional regulator [Cupriavidus sp. SK-3]MDF3888851.1 MarR family transcriptional regulator [Cupriavidus basilensis]